VCQSIKGVIIFQVVVFLDHVDAFQTFNNKEENAQNTICIMDTIRMLHGNS